MCGRRSDGWGFRVALAAPRLRAPAAPARRWAGELRYAAAHLRSRAGDARSAARGPRRSVRRPRGGRAAVPLRPRHRERPWRLSRHHGCGALRRGRPARRRARPREPRDAHHRGGDHRRQLPQRLARHRPCGQQCPRGAARGALHPGRQPAVAGVAGAGRGRRLHRACLQRARRRRRRHPRQRVSGGRLRRTSIRPSPHGISARGSSRTCRACCRCGRRSPAIDVAVLRRLPEWFETPNADFPLSPRDEHTAKPKDEEAEAVFRCLQRRNRVKLVEPIDEEDMYCAAISGTGCRLTALGRRY
jgi:hypothetical protein